MPVVPSRRHLALSAAIAAALAATSVTFATTHTWTGNFDGSWQDSTNWSPEFVQPSAGVDTALVFGAANTYAMTNDLYLPYLLNSMTFTSAAAQPYTIGGSRIDFDDSATLFPSITQSSAQNVTFNNLLTLSSNLFLDGFGSGTLFLNGPIDGAGEIRKNGGGTAVLGAANSFTSNVSVTGGVLSIAHPRAIPSGRNVTVGTGAQFRVGYTSGENSAGPIGTLSLAGGTLRVPAGSGHFYLNRLSVSDGGAIDLSGSSNFVLRFVGAAPRIDLTGNTTWTGGASFLMNFTSSAVELNLNGATLTNGIKLVAASADQDKGFRINGGGGGRLVQTAPGGPASLVFDNFAFYQFADPNFVTSLVTLQGASVMNYTGASPAVLTSGIILGSGGGQIGASNTLTVSGVISETGGTGRPLFITGPVVLAGNNTYTGKTDIYANGVASVGSIFNGGIASLLGASSAAPANLVIQDGTLRYTGGFTATTDRGITVAHANARIDISDADADLTVGGPIVGTGTLNKLGPGTLTLTNSTSNWSGGTVVSGGVLAVAPTSGIIPAGTNVTVNAGAELRLGQTGNNASAPIGQLSLSGGALRAPFSSGDYYVNRLAVSNGGAVDLTDSVVFFLRLVGAGAGVSVTGNSTWVGGGGSLIRNDTAAAVDFNLNGATLTNGVRLGGGSNFQGFRIVGGGGTLEQTAAGSTAPLVLDGFAFYKFADPTFVTSGALIVQGSSVLNYSGASPAVLGKSFALGSGGGQIQSVGTLTLNGTISETGGTGRPLFIVGPVVLAGNNTYTGKTDIYADGVASVASIPNGGLAGPLGASPAAAANLNIQNGTLRYTGSTATTDRGFNLAHASARIEVSTAGTNLTFGGQVTGTGGLTKTGPGTLTLAGATSNTHAGDTTVTAGTLVLAKNGGAVTAVAVPGALIIDGPATVLTMFSNQIADTSTVTLRATAGTATLDTNLRNESIGRLSGVGTVTGFGTLTAGAVDGPTAAGAGGVTVAGGTTLTTNWVRQDAPTVNGIVNLQPRSAGGDTSVVHTLTIGGTTGAWTGRLDLADTALVIDYDPATGSPLATVADQVASGRAGGAWTGPGIRSSSTGGTLSLGVAEASRALGAGGGTFQGVSVDGTAVLVRLTRPGDANVDGSVNGSDLSLLLNNFGATSGRTWQDGDFNYDKAVNGSDLSLLLNNFGGSAGLAALTAGEAAQVAALGESFVPEPGGVSAAAGLAAMGLLARRRR